MTPQQFEYVQQLFLRVRDMQSDERAALLSDEDTVVRNEVESLLGADEKCGTFLEQGVLDSSPSTNLAVGLATDRVMPQPPKNVGPYRLLQQIGEGGHGSVYMAEQTEPIARKVAIKLIKPGMDSKQVLARFHAERQALAMMDHPSIARVLDAGTTETGAPFFVMELVKGIPIHDFCEQNSLDLNERLKLFLQVCEAVHHAHRKGVIHRDLKPSNVLVTMGEAEPLAKVIDFGIAKALDNRLTERTLFTEYGQMIGTLEYMSPEQAEMSAVDIDTRSDVYSLGVLLYRLLTGETPISKEQLLSKGMLEISRQIRDTEPVRPSSRITKRYQQTSSTRAKSDSDAVRGLLNLPSNELDWITMKALAKDRRRRYDSALDFGRDVNRFLDGQPVHAHPPSAFYKFAKIARRHRIAAVTTFLVVASSLLGVVGLSVGLRQAIKLGNEARQAKSEADESARRLAENMYTDLLQSAWRATKAHDTDRAEELLDACLPEMRGWEWRFASSQNKAEPHTAIREKGKRDVSQIQIQMQKRASITAFVLDDGGVEVWDTVNDQLMRSLSGVSQANVAAISADGSKILVGTSKGELLSIRTSDFELEKSKRLGHGGIYDIDVASDGNRIAICTGGGYVEVLDKNLNIIDKWQTSRASSVSMTPGTDRLMAAGLDGNLYALQIGREEVQTSFVSEASLQKILQIDESHIAVISMGSVVELDMDELDASPQTLIRGTGMATAATTNTNGDVFLGCGDGALFVSGTNSAQRKIADFNVAINALATQHNDLLVALSDGRVLRIDPASPNPGWQRIGEEKTVAGHVVSSHNLIVTLDTNGRMNTTMMNGEPRESVQAHSTASWAVASDKPGTILATVGEDQRLRCWELPSLEMRFERAIDWGVRDVCVSPDGKWIAAAPPAGEKLGTQEGTIGIWDAKTGECTQLLQGHDNWVLKMSPTPDGKGLVSSGENRTTRIWDIERKGSVVISPEGKSPVVHHAFDPSSAKIYLGHRDGWVTSWSMTSGEPAETWPAFGDAITGLAVTSDHRILATSRSSELLRVHDIRTQKNIADFDLGFGYVSQFQLSKDEKRVTCITQEQGFQLVRE